MDEGSPFKEGYEGLGFRGSGFRVQGLGVIGILKRIGIQGHYGDVLGLEVFASISHGAEWQLPFSLYTAHNPKP